jgi:threonine dehydrogenase-like Zn-dependent dehydrogenase
VFAGQIQRRGRIEIVEVPEARLDGPGEILFQPSTACLCGSDLPFFDGEHLEYPLRPGLSLHEMVGTVVESSGSHFRAGEKVLAVPVGQAGFFERYALSEERAVPIDPRIPSEEMAVLAQPLGTVIYALKKLPPLVDAEVAVVGQGPMGQIFCATLRNLGAREIIAIDRLRSRLERSPGFGATVLIDSSAEDPVEAVERATAGRLCDLVIECVGHRDQQLDLCARLCRHGGRVLCFGVPPDRITVEVWRQLFNRNITIHTSVDPDFRRDFPLAMRWIAERRVDVSRLITHRFPLRGAQEAFETFRDRCDGALKVILELPR